MKRAILAVTFGAGGPEARKAYDQIDARVKDAFPDAEIRWAYTSRAIRAKQARLEMPLDSPEVALARLMEENYTHVAVLSLHTIPGIEFHQLHHNAMLFGEMKGGFQCIRVARPLLSSHADLLRAAAALMRHIPEDRNPKDAVLFMGHGSKNHPAGALYSAMNHILQDVSENVYVATLGAYPTLNDILPKLVGKSVRRVYLIPLMSVVGSHVRKDMAGEQPDSWKSLLTRSGFACEIIMKGTAEYPEIVEIWLDHLKDALPELAEPVMLIPHNRG